MHAVNRTGAQRPRPVVAASLGALAAGLLWVVMTVVSAGPASADNGGAPICIDGVCTIGVSAPGAPGSGGGGGSGGPVTVSDPAACTNTDPLSGCDPCPLDGTAPADPAACAAFSQSLFCSEQNPAGTGASAATWETYLELIGCAANAFTPPDPAVLAVQAAAEFDLASPTIDRSPDADLRYDGYAYTYANLATWFWTSPGSWSAQSKTVTVHSAVAGDVWATATAAPTVLVFDPGDGDSAVSCAGPGQAWQPSDGNGAAPSGCSYIYRAATPGPVTVTVSIDWQVTWTGSYGMGGVLPVQVTAAAQQLQVLQVDSVNR